MEYTWKRAGSRAMSYKAAIYDGHTLVWSSERRYATKTQAKAAAEERRPRRLAQCISELGGSLPQVTP